MPITIDAEHTFRDLFAEGLQPDYAAALAKTVVHYAQDWFTDAAAKRRTLDPETWLRDITVTALVFMTTHKFKIAEHRACYYVANAAMKANYTGKGVLSPTQVEDIVRDHVALTIKLKSVVDQ